MARADLHEVGEQIRRDIKKPARKAPAPRAAKQQADDQPNPPRAEAGEKGPRSAYLRQTITMSSKMLSELRAAGYELRAEGRRDTGISELIRQAAHEWLERHRASR